LRVRVSNHKGISLYKRVGFQDEEILMKIVKVKGRCFADIVMDLDLLAAIPVPLEFVMGAKLLYEQSIFHKA